MKSLFKGTNNKIGRQEKGKAGTMLRMAVTGCLLCGSASLYAQTPNWQWAKSAGGLSCSASATSIASDAQGNMYITGDFVGGNMIFGTTTVPPSSMANNTVFVAKYSKEGNVLWAKSCEQGFNAGSSAIATDAQGNVYVTGYFGSWIKFGTITLNATNAESDIFIAKFNSSGSVLWAKKAGSTGFDESRGIATDSDGNVIFCGSFSGATAIFDTKTVTGGGEANLFIAKYDSNGSALWAKGGTSTGITTTASVRTDASKNVYVTGQYMNAALTLGTSTLANSGSSDIFIAKYDPSGNVTWAKGMGGTSADAPGDIAVDATGNVYVSGTFLGSVTVGATTLTSAGNMDCLIAKYSPTGVPVWAKSGGGEGVDMAAGIVVDKNGHVNMTGSYGLNDKTAAFGTTTLTNAGMNDLFIARYDANGALLLAKGIGGTNMESGRAMRSDANANLYLTGVYMSPSLAFAGNTLTHPGGTGNAVFIAKYGTPTTGIDELRMTDSWKAYPNPAGGIFNIEYREEIREVRVTNVLGQVVYHSEVANNNNKVDLSNQPQGLYWLYISTAEGYGVKQITIRR